MLLWCKEFFAQNFSFCFTTGHYFCFRDLSVHFCSTVYTCVWVVVFNGMINSSKFCSNDFVIMWWWGLGKNELREEAPAALLAQCLSVLACLSIAAFPLLLTSTSLRHNIQKKLNSSFLLFVTNPCSFAHSRVKEVFRFGIFRILVQQPRLANLMFTVTESLIDSLVVATACERVFWRINT